MSKKPLDTIAIQKHIGWTLVSRVYMGAEDDYHNRLSGDVLQSYSLGQFWKVAVLYYLRLVPRAPVLQTSHKSRATLTPLSFFTLLPQPPLPSPRCRYATWELHSGSRERFVTDGESVTDRHRFSAASRVPNTAAYCWWGEDVAWSVSEGSVT